MNKIKPVVLSAFASLLVVTVAGCVEYRQCGLEGCPNDEKITSNVQARLNHNSALGAPDSITVQTLKGVVYLNGQVDGGLEKRTAEAEAKHVPGVTRVVNNIAVQHD